MNATVYVGPQDEHVVDLMAVSEAFRRKTNLEVEFTRMVVKPKMFGRAPLLCIDGGMLGTCRTS